MIITDAIIVFGHELFKVSMPEGFKYYIISDVIKNKPGNKTVRKWILKK